MPTVLGDRAAADIKTQIPSTRQSSRTWGVQDPGYLEANISELWASENPWERIRITITLG